MNAICLFCLLSSSSKWPIDFDLSRKLTLNYLLAHQQLFDLEMPNFLNLFGLLLCFTSILLFINFEGSLLMGTGHSLIENNIKFH
jgi:hypothetical protein